MSRKLCISLFVTNTTYVVGLDNMANTSNTSFYAELIECKKRITNSKPRKLKGRAGQYNLAPSSTKHWRKISFFSRVSNIYRYFAIQQNIEPLGVFITVHSASADKFVSNCQ